jgi:hypothetical protein
MEIIADANGRIIAMCPTKDEPIARPKHSVQPSSPAQIPNAVPTLRPRPGQVRHVVELPAELAGMSLKEIHTTHRIVVHAGKSRLERITE